MSSSALAWLISTRSSGGGIGLDLEGCGAADCAVAETACAPQTSQMTVTAIASLFRFQLVSTVPFSPSGRSIARRWNPKKLRRIAHIGDRLQQWMHGASPCHSRIRRLHWRAPFWQDQAHRDLQPVRFDGLMHRVLVDYTRRDVIPEEQSERDE